MELSPQFIIVVILSPSLSIALIVKLTVKFPGVLSRIRFISGGLFALIIITFEIVVLLAPILSKTVSVILYIPSFKYEWLTFCPYSIVPSSRFQV